MSRKSISSQDYELLRQLLSLHERSLLGALPKILNKYYNQDNIYSTSQYIYVVGNIPITLVAHLDTVHNQPPRSIYHDPKNGVIWTPEGLGADDRAGVFSIIYLLEQGHRPSIIFTSGEEVGGIGAQSFIKDYPDPMAETFFLIELDRQGANDAVYYECGNREFEHFITNFGFTTDLGSFSDIVIIGPTWDRASVNLSIGYVNEHTPAEMLFYHDMFCTIDRVEQILTCGDIKLYDYQTNDSKWLKYFNSDGLEIQLCDCCALPIESHSIVQIGYGKRAWYLCGECAEKHSSVCKKCGQRFINPHHTVKIDLCEDCECDSGYKY